MQSLQINNYPFLTCLPDFKIKKNEDKKEATVG